MISDIKMKPRYMLFFACLLYLGMLLYLGISASGQALIGGSESQPEILEAN